MDPSLRVAFVRSDRRRQAVAEALALVVDGLRGALPSDAHVLLKASFGTPCGSTDPDTLSATVDSLFAVGARRIDVVDSACERPDRLGLRGELWGRPVDFLGLGNTPIDPDPLRLLAADGTQFLAGVAARVASADFRVSLASIAADPTAGLAISLSNMLGCLDDRSRSLLDTGDGRSGPWGRLARFLTPRYRKIHRPDNLRLPTKSEVVRGRAAQSMGRNLVRLQRRVPVRLAIVDGFDLRDGGGRRHRLGFVVAGLNPVAVDSVAASAVGYDPLTIPALGFAESAGLGPIDLDAIGLVGDPIFPPRRRFAPHPDWSKARFWPGLGDPSTDRPRPHVSPGRTVAHATEIIR